MTTTTLKRRAQQGGKVGIVTGRMGLVQFNQWSVFKETAVLLTHTSKLGLRVSHWTSLVLGDTQRNQRAVFHNVLSNIASSIYLNPKEQQPLP
jgi:hypothetical protein